MVNKILRKVDDERFVYGIDGKGGVYVFCKKCNITMNLINMEFSKNKKIFSFVCSKCKTRKVVRNNLF